MKSPFCFLTALLLVCSAATISADDTPPLNVLLVDGQNNHKWAETTPLIQATLESGGFANVTVITAPAKGATASDFSPTFSDYDVVVSNYNGEAWPRSTEEAFEAYVGGGGGFVTVHAADNSFPKWEAYNRMIGIGGWGGRNEKDGPYVRWKEDQKKFTRDMSKGRGGQHGKRVPFMMVVRDSAHPITEGLPNSFLQVADELYGQLRGPAENMHVLATAYSNPATGGTGEHEPILMTIHYGDGRVFHTTLGHDVAAMKGLAFQTTLRRGTQWAAKGTVTLASVSSSTMGSDTPAEGEPTEASKAEGDAPAVAMKADKGGIDFDAAPDLKAEGWQSLFDGKSLTGWSLKNGTAKYIVQDGAIVGTTSEGSPNSFLCSANEYGDFELTFEVNVDNGLNSGVQIRSQAREKDGRVNGPQVEIESAPGEAGYLYSEATGRGWITKEQPIKDAFQNGVFNRYLVRAKGDRIQVWIGDQKISDIEDPESYTRGFLGLQVHSIKAGSGPFTVRWKNIQIREI